MEKAGRVGHGQRKYMSMLALVGLLALCSAVPHAQAQVGINTWNPDENAELEVVSTTKGVLIPKLTNTEKNVLQGVTTLSEGMLIYNTDEGCVQVFTGTVFECVVIESSYDSSPDSWVDDSANSMVKLGTKSDHISPRDANTDVVIKDDGKVGIGTDTPAQKLDVEGNMRFSGALMPGGQAGAMEQLLLSRGSGAVPGWEALGKITGTLSEAHYMEGTKDGMELKGYNDSIPWNENDNRSYDMDYEEPNINEAGDIEGLVYSVTVPEGERKLVTFIISGYATRTEEHDDSFYVYPNAGYNGSQGVFELYQSDDGGLNREKISSAYASAGSTRDGNTVGDVDNDNIPLSATILRSVELEPGDYEFYVSYRTWYADQRINDTVLLGGYGYDDLFHTKMIVSVYNL